MSIAEKTNLCIITKKIPHEKTMLNPNPNPSSNPNPKITNV